MRGRRARIDECLMTIFGYTPERKSRQRIDVDSRYVYIGIYAYSWGYYIIIRSHASPRFIYIYKCFFFVLCKRQRRTTGADRQTDRQTEAERRLWRTADGPAVISAPGQISINNVRQGFQYKPSPLAAASTAALPIFPAIRRTSKLAVHIYIK